MIRAWSAPSVGAKFEQISYDPGPMKGDDVEIAVTACGLCHSDLSLWEDEWGITQFPLTPGHEVVGTITQIGDTVTHLKVGDTVGVGWFSRSCLNCDPCMHGDHNMCVAVEQIAVGRHGGFAEKVRVQASWATKLPDGLKAEDAGPLFCGGITVFNPIVQFGVKPTDKVGVIGIGGLGHLAVQFLNAWGCEVTAFTSTGAKADEARRMGAHRIVDSRDADAIQAEAGRFDFILTTVAVDLDWSLYLNALGPRGRLHTVGVPPSAIPAHAFQLIGAQRSLSGSPLGSPATIRDMLEFCARHDISPMVERLPMSRIDEAMDKLKNGSPRYRIVLDNDFS
jgi:uncharacterized zinc-type alcohol dehydrogenase-like protein